MFSPIRGDFRWRRECCSCIACPASRFVRETGLLERIAPRMAAAEALMPELGVERGVTLDAYHPRRRKEAGDRRIFHRLRDEFHAGLDQQVVRPAADRRGL